MHGLFITKHFGAAGFTNLRDLSLQGCEGLSSLSALTDLSKVTSLNLKGCSGISGLRHLSGALFCASLG